MGASFDDGLRRRSVTLRTAAWREFESLEQRMLYSAGLTARVPLDIAAVNPSLLYDHAAASVNTKNDDGLSIHYQPATYTLQNLNGSLSPAQSGSPLKLARAFLTAHAAELNLKRSDVAGAIVTDQYTDSDTGTTHIYMRQAVHGVAIINADLGIHISRDGRVLSVSSSFISDAAKQLRGTNVAAISATQAVTRGGAKLNLKVRRTLHATQSGVDWSVQSADVSLDPIPASKQYMATADGIVPVWTMVVRPPDGSHDWYSLAVRTGDGETVFANNWTDKASYRVYPLPAKAPNDALGRTLLIDPADPIASPFGWQDTNGVAGAEFTDTRGNNVFAQEDQDGNNTGGTRPDGGAGLNFDFPLDLNQSPASYQSASTTNLFYLVNALHDIHYHYGFNEAAGNFQVNNYGRGGTGNDPVLADDQDGSGSNNANFSTPPEGTSPRMQMYDWFTGTDGAFDATIVAHEFGHGISTRLTGGADNSDALDTQQSASMGEGWSDWWALMLTMKAGDDISAGYGIANYVLGQPASGSGLRRYPYSFNMATDPETFGLYNGVYGRQEVHSAGEIWCSALFDMSWLLIQKNGFDANLSTGYTGAGSAGNKLALQLVMDALKLQPVNPSMLDARNAVLLADENLTSGQNQKEIWQAFARRGMGLSAYDGGNSASRAVREAFDVPAFLGGDSYVVSTDPIATAITPPRSVSFKFNEAMDPSLFSLADDVLSFTAPGNVDIKPQISSFTFSPDAKTLTLNFPAQQAVGTYSITLSPNILSVDNGHALDQNRNGIAGEATADQFITTFTYRPFVGPDTFGYKAGVGSYEDLHLLPGAAGVTSVLGNDDDDSVSIDLGSDAFTFYGTTYTGAGKLFINPNGQIAFNSPTSTFPFGDSSYAHTDLTSSPFQPIIAPLWRDWFTFVDSTDQVLYRFDDQNNDGQKDRLVIEWHSLRDPATGAPGSVTFQAILQLNTGGQAGTILFNYVDLDGGNFSTLNGNNATVGIKSIGASSHLLVSRDPLDNPFLGSNKAVRISTDWTPPVADAPAFEYLTQQAITVHFSENVKQSLSAQDFVLKNLTTNQTIAAADLALAYDAAANTATITFPGYQGILPDGNYSLSVGAASVSDLSGNALPANVASSFFVLGGDANHDTQVGAADFTALAIGFAQPNPTFETGDFNYDHVVNALDFNLLASQFGASAAALPGDEISGASEDGDAAVAAIAPFSEQMIDEKVFGSADGSSTLVGDVLS